MIPDPFQMDRIAAACLVECKRQQVGLYEFGGLIRAYSYAIRVSKDWGGEIKIIDIENIAEMIEPRARSYRNVPVVFRNGKEGIHHSVVWDAVYSLFHNGRSLSPEDFVKNLLEIHPWEDGNGRTAFVVYNWLKGTLLEPLPLPDLFGDRR